MKASLDVVMDDDISTKVYLYLLSKTYATNGQLIVGPYTPSGTYISDRTGETVKTVRKSISRLKESGIVSQVENGYLIRDSFTSRFVNIDKDCAAWMVDNLTRDEASLLLYLMDKHRYSKQLGRQYTFSLGSVAKAFGKTDSSYNRKKTRGMLDRLESLGAIELATQICEDKVARNKLTALRSAY